MNACKHLNKEIRRHIFSNGIRVYQYQCVQCGTSIGTYLKHVDVLTIFKDLNDVKDWDKRLEKSYIEKIRNENETYWEERRKKSKEEQQEFDEKYESHMKSDKWMEIRMLKLKQANYICEGCGKERATTVHHFSYNNLGEEFLFELAAVCVACHQRLHPKRLIKNDIV